MHFQTNTYRVNSGIHMEHFKCYYTYILVWFMILYGLFGRGQHDFCPSLILPFLVRKMAVDKIQGNCQKS